MLKRLVRKQGTGSTSLSLIDRPINAPGIAVKRLLLRIDLIVASTAGLTLVAESFCWNSWLTIKDRNGKPIYNQLQWLGCEALSVVKSQGVWNGYKECVDRTITVQAGNQVTYYIEVPFTDALSARPEDWQQSLANIGEVTINVGATGTATVTVTSFYATLMMEYANKSSMAIAPRRMARMAPADTTVQHQIPLARGRLVNLLALTVDNANSPLSLLDGPTITIDQQPALVDLQDFDVLALNLFRDQPFYGQVVARDTLTDTKVAILVTPEQQWSIADRPSGTMLVAEYQANTMGSGDLFYLTETIEPMDEACLAGPLKNLGIAPQNAIGLVDQPRLEPGVADAELRMFLPIKISLPGNAGGGCAV